jgi:hypothetical protein
MNTADLARLELAKRAYQATQAGEAEVQTGVRRARLALTRPKRRRSWFSKGLVFVVLAVGSMAYAKPNALGELVEKVLPREDGAGKRGAGGRLAALAAPIEEATKLGHATRSLKGLGASTLKRNVADDGELVASREVEAAAEKVAATAKKTSRSATVSTNAARTNAALAAALADGSSSAPASEAKATKPTSDWGRVGQALANGNQAEALAALAELSASGDERTRDKADLGRAQLLMSQGETTAACSLARSLTHRRAGSRIERQAQLLLKSCL